MRTMRLKKFFILSIALNLVFLGGFSWLLYQKGGIPYVRQKVSELLVFHPEGKRQETQKTRREPHYLKFYTTLHDRLGYQPDDIIFIGDSHIRLCPWAELFRNARIKNRGMMGDTVDGLLNRIAGIQDLSADKIFIMIGINDIFYIGTRNDEIYKKYASLIKLIRRKNNQAKIYILSILPVEDKGDDREIVNKNVFRTNEMLKNFASRERGIYYIDLYGSFLSDDHLSLNKRYSYDGLHLNSEGYVQIKRMLLMYMS